MPQFNRVFQRLVPASIGRQGDWNFSDQWQYENILLLQQKHCPPEDDFNVEENFFDPFCCFFCKVQALEDWRPLDMKHSEKWQPDAQRNFKLESMTLFQTKSILRRPNYNHTLDHIP